MKIKTETLNAEQLEARRLWAEDMKDPEAEAIRRRIEAVARATPNLSYQQKQLVGCFVSAVVDRKLF